MTNLAIKGIIGIAAMAEISQVVGNVSAAQQYQVSEGRVISLSRLTPCYHKGQRELVRQTMGKPGHKLWSSFTDLPGHEFIRLCINVQYVC